MSRKSRQRMMAGRFEARTGQTVYGKASRQPQVTGPLTPARRARLLEYLAVIPEGERDQVRAFLRGDGSAQAAALLAELEEKWAPPGRE